MSSASCRAASSLAALLTLITDVESLGLETAQGLYLASPFYWDLNDRTRAFSARFSARMKGAQAHHAAGRRLFRRSALPEGGQAGETAWTRRR